MFFIITEFFNQNDRHARLVQSVLYSQYVQNCTSVVGVLPVLFDRRTLRAADSQYVRARSRGLGGRYTSCPKHDII